MLGLADKHTEQLLELYSMCSSSVETWKIQALMAESKEQLKSLLMRVKEESKKASLKLNIQKTKIMASGPTTSWQIDGEKVEAVTDVIFFIFPKSLWTVTAAMKLKDTCSLDEKLWST